MNTSHFSVDGSGADWSNENASSTSEAGGLFRMTPFGTKCCNLAVRRARSAVSFSLPRFSRHWQATNVVAHNEGARLLLLCFAQHGNGREVNLQVQCVPFASQKGLQGCGIACFVMFPPRVSSVPLSSLSPCLTL